jgi:hypothetical protein
VARGGGVKNDATEPSIFLVQAASGGGGGGKGGEGKKTSGWQHQSPPGNICTRVPSREWRQQQQHHQQWWRLGNRGMQPTTCITSRHLLP